MRWLVAGVIPGWRRGEIRCRYLGLARMVERCRYLGWRDGRSDADTWARADGRSDADTWARADGRSDADTWARAMTNRLYLIGWGLCPHAPLQAMRCSTTRWGPSISLNVEPGAR